MCQYFHLKGLNKLKLDKPNNYIFTQEYIQNQINQYDQYISITITATEYHYAFNTNCQNSVHKSIDHC